MKVCHVCNAHHIEDSRVFYRMCVALAEAGYEVHLFATGNGGQAYCDRGVIIHPLPPWLSQRDRLARRSRVAQMAADLRPDLFHVHEPELLGSVIACAGPRPVVYDVHESYLDVLLERHWIPPRVRPIVRFAWDHWERHLLRRCAGVVVVTERIAQRYYRLHRNVRVVANCPDLSYINDLPPATRDGMTCVYAGVLTPSRGMLQIIEAIAMLKARGLAVRLDLAGRPVSEAYLSKLWSEVNRLGIQELVNYHGVLPSKHDLLMLQQRASIALVLNQPIANYLASLPNRLGECMGLGLPVVFSDFPNFREVVGTSGAGIPVDPTKPEQIAHAIERLLRAPDVARQMGEAGRRVVNERFNWNIEQGKLLDLYQDIIGSSRHHKRQLLSRGREGSSCFGAAQKSE